MHDVGREVKALYLIIMLLEEHIQCSDLGLLYLRLILNVKLSYDFTCLTTNIVISEPI
jgi:hypothetical protein